MPRYMWIYSYRFYTQEFGIVDPPPPSFLLLGEKNLYVEASKDLDKSKGRQS